MQTIVYKNRYVVAGILIYLLSFITLTLVYNQPVTDLLPHFSFFVVLFPLIVYAAFKNNTSPLAKPVASKETPVLIALILLILLYVTFLSPLLNDMLPYELCSSQCFMLIYPTIKKLVFFVLIPLLVYRYMGFRAADFGLSLKLKRLFTVKNMLIITALTALSLVFQFCFGRGAKTFLQPSFGFTDYAGWILLTLLYLLMDVGLVEEFFFRGLLTGRLSVILKSQSGGVILSSLIFGLIHVPGLYLRGAQSEGIEESLPLTFFITYTIVYMSAGGIFLGMLYNKTRNLWLSITVHVIIDLVPNFNDFVKSWLQ